MRILHQLKTKYHLLQVLQCGKIRFLCSGTGICREQSAIKVDDLNKHVFDYSLLAMQSLSFVPEPLSVLVIGLGGGIIPRILSGKFPNAKIDVIEIDEEIIDIAKKFFFFEETNNIRVHHGDAFVVTQEMREKYDIIFCDCFLSDYIPFPLMSLEFIRQLDSLTLENAVINVNCSCWHPSFPNQVNTYRKVFGDNIYWLQGIQNSLSTTLYVIKGGLKIDHSTTDVSLTPIKIEISEEIKKAKIFTLQRP